MCSKHDVMAALVVAADAVQTCGANAITKNQMLFELHNAARRVASGNRYTVENALIYSLEAVRPSSAAASTNEPEPSVFVVRTHELIRDCLRTWLGDA